MDGCGRPFLKRRARLFFDEGVSGLSESVSSARFLDIWRRPGGELCERLGDRERDGATGLGAEPATVEGGVGNEVMGAWAGERGVGWGF